MTANPAKRRNPGGVPNIAVYWGTLAAVFTAAWMCRPLVVTSVYCTCCLMLSSWQDHCGAAAAYQPQQDTAVGTPQSRQRRRWARRKQSVALSLVNCVLADSVIAVAVRQRPELLYSHDEAHSSMMWAGYTYLSPILLLLIHDAWFYATHRACHRSKIAFKYIHWLHHERTDPEAWDLFYMHPAECLVCVVLPFIVTPRVLPLHWLMWEGFLVKGVLIDCYGHCGYDAAPFHPFKITQFSLIPRFPYHHVFLKAKHHDDHHLLQRGNFSLYFPLWDRLLGTEIVRKAER